MLLLKKIDIDEKTFKFILIGFLNTIIGASIMFFSYNVIGLTYWVSSALNYILASIFSYFANKYFTFNKRGKSIKEIVAFIVNIFICYLIAYGVAKPLVGLFLTGTSISVSENVSMAVGMVIFVGLNYIGQRYFVFARK